MNTRTLIMALALCIVLCILVGTLVEQAHAQKSSISGDRSLAEKKGLEVLGGSQPKKLNQATKLQGALGIGSIFVMVAVIKWL